jgi:hypothetical protein
MSTNHALRQNMHNVTQERELREFHSSSRSQQCTAGSRHVHADCSEEFGKSPMDTFAAVAAVVAECTQYSPTDEIWARLEQRMSSPPSVASRGCKQPNDAVDEHVFVTNHGDGHLKLQQQVGECSECFNSSCNGTVCFRKTTSFVQNTVDQEHGSCAHLYCHHRSQSFAELPGSG